MEIQIIQRKIHEIRGVRVMLDFDLASLYEVETRVLNQAVKRNSDRFPSDFMFQLLPAEFENLISQNVTSSWGGTRKLPYAFTEQGVAMLSGLLKSKVAIEVNISVMRAFVAMRQYITSTAIQGGEITELRERIKALERGGEETLEAVNDLSEDMRREIADVYQAIGELSARPTSGLDPNRRMIGYRTDNN